MAESVGQANFGLNCRNANKSQVKLAPFPPHARKLHFSLRYESAECRSKGYSIIVLFVLINIIDSSSSSLIHHLHHMCDYSTELQEWAQQILHRKQVLTRQPRQTDAQSEVLLRCNWQGMETGLYTFQASLLFLQAAIERKMGPLLLLGWD